MAKKVALAFSLVVDPANPLLLDEGDTVENLCRWEELEPHGSSSIMVPKSEESDEIEE